MAPYQNLKSRIDEGEVVVLDGAIGTELQAMGVPMHPASWCGPGNYTHTATVRQMHQRYIKAGADIITTNTFNTLRPALEASGYPDLVREINIRSVDAALEARERTPVDRPIYIAGSISCRIPVRDGRTGSLLGGTGFGYGASLPAAELRAYVDEQADIMAESGIDFFIMENMWSDNESRIIAAEAAMATGLPVWVGFTASVAEDGQTVLMSFGDDRNAYSSGMGMPMWTSDWRSVDYENDARRGHPRGRGPQPRRHNHLPQPDRRDHKSPRSRPRRVVRHPRRLPRRRQTRLPRNLARQQPRQRSLRRRAGRRGDRLDKDGHPSRRHLLRFRRQLHRSPPKPNPGSGVTSDNDA